jgi:hypothetical protein
MPYRATPESSTQSPDERVSEARRIVIDMGLYKKIPNMDFDAGGFVEKLRRDLGRNCAVVSVKQLWFLRDLLERFG